VAMGTVLPQVTRVVSSSSLSDMSSDPFADLASSTEAFATGFREFMTRNLAPAPGSPADIFEHIEQEHADG
jgi:hypothetical protein